MPNPVTTTRVDVKRRSGFDKSFKNILTTKVGTITPLAYKLLIPNSDFNLSVAISAALPPLAADTFMRCSLKVEAFAVPLRLLYGGFTSWLTGEEIYNLGDSGPVASRAKLPRWRVVSGSNSNNNKAETRALPSGVYGRGSLFDYLGFRSAPASPTAADDMYLNLFLPLCYHRIYDDWYRNRKVQKPVFGRPTYDVDNRRAFVPIAATLPYIAMDKILDISNGSPLYEGDILFDNVGLHELRQRNYGSDYFTEAMPEAQFGSEQRVTIDGSNGFTISALRLANAMQVFEEKNNLSSPALQDYCLVNYGAHLKDGVAQRAVYLGSASYDVYSKGVVAQGTTDPTNNPFGSVGARYGSAFASGSDFVVKGHVDEPCYLMVMATLVPEANYAFGIKKDLTIFTEEGSLMDLPNPAFELVGNEPIYSREVGDYDPAQYDNVFAWTKRYMWHKTAYNEVHGLLLEGESLAAFVAQRAIDRGAALGSDFLQIGTDDLDNVTAVTGDLSRYGCWVDSFIKLTVVEPLGESALPSLVDPATEHGESVYIRNNGSRL